MLILPVVPTVIRELLVRSQIIAINRYVESVSVVIIVVMDAYVSLIVHAHQNWLLMHAIPLTDIAAADSSCLAIVIVVGQVSVGAGLRHVTVLLYGNSINLLTGIRRTYNEHNKSTEYN